jgi:UDP-MurNAc hydroxylase
MQIAYLGHAGFLVETERAIVIMDPWLSPEGAFDSAWFQYPCNHHLAPFVRAKLQDSRKERFIYVSHEHHDHFDLDFLKALPVSDFTFVVPHFQRDALRTQLASLRGRRVVSCTHGQQLDIPGGFVKLFLDDSGMNRDSGILVKSGDESFLNLNDCKLYDQVSSIANDAGHISVFACQFSGATWHPTCYDYPPAEYQRISHHKLTSKFEMVARAIDAVRPGLYLPSAGPACFLDPTLLHLNFEPVNIFPRAPQFLDFLRARLPDLPTKLLDITPGDVVSAANGTLDSSGEERVPDESFETYIRAYSARYRDYFADRQPRHSDQQLDSLWERLRVELQRKLASFVLHERIHVPLYFGFSDSAARLLRLDFPAGKVDFVSAISEADFYSIHSPSWQIARVLDGSITWEELALTFRVRLNRKPDVYQTLIQGFLLMQPEDMNWFCARIVEVEERKNRVIVEAGGTKYSIDRFCPHQGGDLSQGWLHEGRFWTCPRHRWQFDLERGGQCTTSSGSIHAVCLEND